MSIKQILVPDIGDYKDVPVIEMLVKPGDTVKAEQSLLTLETDKATMDVPAPFDGVVTELNVKVGDKISQGTLILSMQSDEALPIFAPVAAGTVVPVADKSGSISPDSKKPSPTSASSAPTPPSATVSKGQSEQPFVPSASRSGSSRNAHASPSIRRFARELGVDLAGIKGSGQKARVTKEDVQNFVKAALAQPHGGSGLQIAEMPQVDFAKFGAIETRPLSRIKKIAGANLHRNWVSIPHVTQFDEADITAMEVVRKQWNEQHAAQNIKMTPLAFLLKAVVAALQEFPDFNASLDASGENLVLKKYFHIGVAVDTPVGLMVPVLRDADKKDLVQLAKELGEVSAKARDKKLSATEMQGGCFSISSLGGIGGTAFTPIINAPEVAILGVSRSTQKPVYIDGKFVPRLMLPLSLSYDHRVIDGAAAARFTTYLAQVLADTRRLTL